MYQLKRCVMIGFLCIILSLGHVGIDSLIFAEEKINMGNVTVDAELIINRFAPLLEYLKTQGMNTGKVIIYRTPEQAIDSLVSGECDFMVSTPNVALQLMDGAGAIPFLISMKGGVKYYNAVIFVKKGSPVQHVSDLEGKVIAFETELSTSSYILPRNILINAGLELQPSNQPVPGKVAYYFTKGDVNTVAHVKSEKRADAGGIQKAFLENHPEYDKFRILAESPYVPRVIILARQGYAYELLKEHLLGMNTDPVAQDVLKHMQTAGFAEFDDDPVEFMNTIVRNALEPE